MVNVRLFPALPKLRDKVCDDGCLNKAELPTDTRDVPVLLKNKLEDKGPDIYSLPKIH